MTEYMSDREQIISLWIEGFGDKRADVELFLDTIFDEKNYFCIKENGKILSQTFLVPVKLSSKGKDFEGYYFCCAATRKDERGKGHMGRLLEEVKKTAAERGADFVALIPASGSLFNFYSRFGFEEFFYCADEKISAKALENAEFCEIYDSDRLFELQNLCLKSRPGVIVKSRDIYGYLIKDAALSGYKIYSAKLCGREMGYIFYDPENALVREALLSEKCTEILSAFAKAAGKDEICARLFASAERYGNKKGMIFAQNPEVKALKNDFPFINYLLES